MTVPEVSAAFHKPFAEQLAAYRLRLGNLVPTARWDDIERAAHDRAFMVAGAAKADLLADLGLAVDKAIAEGTGLEAFRKDFRAIVKKHGWHGWTGEGTAKGEAWRTRVIYRTNMRTSYMAGRHAQLTEGRYPFWVYRHGGSLEPRIQHLGWDGLVLEVDHPFWATHFPPNGWGCSCRVFGARSREAAKRKGGDPDKVLEDGWQTPDAKTGAPSGIDKGWDYAPGASVAQTVSLAAAKISAMPPELGSSFGGSMSQLIDRAWRLWVADTLAGGSHTAGLVGVVRGQEMRAMAQLGIKPASAEIMVRPGLLSGPKARRHLAKGNALSERDWFHLPVALRQPRAVLRDVRTGKFLYLLPGETSDVQLAVDLDFLQKRRSEVRAEIGKSESLTAA